MATQIRAYLAKGSVNSPTQTFTKPSSPGTVVAGDLLVAHLLINSTATPTTVPSDWTLAVSLIGVTNCQYIYTKTAGGSEPASYDWVWAASHTVNGGIIALYSDIASTLEVQDSDKQTNASSTNRDWPSVTALTTDTILCCFGRVGNPLTSDPAMLERWDQDASFRCYLMTQLLSASGATGTRTATGAVSSVSETISVIIGETAIISGAAAMTEAADTLSATGTVKIQGAASITEADDTLSSAGLRTPDAPQAVEATAISTSRIDITWEDSSVAISGYSVERSANGMTGWSEIADLAPDVFSYADTGLASNTTYYYRVRSYRS